MLRVILIFFLTFSIVPCVAADRPNILLILADDVGIEGLGCYGGVSYRTPNLDRMAANGVRFTSAYSQPLCTPTRVQIMTGKYNHRNWRAFGILDPNARTFGHMLKSEGYATGIFGKWQLQSYDPPDYPGGNKRRGTGMHPQNAGFDEYALFHASHTEDKGSRYTNPTMLEGTAGSADKLKTYSGRYGADVWVEMIVDFFDRHRDQPAFVYYPMALPHWPFEPTPSTPSWDPAQPQAEDLRYATDMIEYMDTAVGNLIHGLRAQGHLENTIVIFYSDNGTHVKVSSKMQDGRTIQGGKATPKQAGIHVPLIAYWPGHFKPLVCDEIVDASDFLPTLRDLARSPPPEETEIDGISFASQLFSRAGPRREHAFFWYDPRPGWDKERFGRHVFALNKHYKLFRDGRLFRLTDVPLEEFAVDPLNMSEEDRQAQEMLSTVIERTMSDVQEPELVNAYGEREHDLLYLPADAKETHKITSELLATGKEVVYGDAQVPAQRMWIFNPHDIQAGELRPCVFFIHGGSWGGRPEALSAQCVYLQRRGFNAVSIHFRAPQGTLTPADTLRDVRRAYRWIVEHGREHHMDVDRIVVSGGSAGGHLALALSTIGLADDPIIDHEPRGFVLFNPVIDLVDGWSAGRKRCAASGIDPRSFSPAHHVRPGLPPTLVLSGREDKLIPPTLIRKFQESMRTAGNECTFIEYPGANHAFFNYGRHDNQYFQWTMWEFEKFLESLDL